MRSSMMIVMLFATACGQNASDKMGASSGGRLSYFPLAVGASWTYRVTDRDSGDTKEKSSTVEAYEDIGGAKAGIEAYRIRTDKRTGETVSWQRVSGDVLERHRERSYDDGLLSAEELYEPFKLRLDESGARTAAGASWIDTYTEHIVDYTADGAQTTVSKSDEWTVVATAEEITVPAGTFTCLHLLREGLTTDSVKSYWFAADVGKVREVGEGQTEELTAYDVP